MIYSFECSCHIGYNLTEDGFTCNGKLLKCVSRSNINFYPPSDIDECSRDNAGCSHICTNANGSYVCECPDGFELQNDTVCVGKHSIHFVSGEPVFTSYNSAYVDIDECKQGTAVCDGNAYCTNTNGSYTCICNSGYSGTGLACSSKCSRRYLSYSTYITQLHPFSTDINECKKLNITCDQNAQCVDTLGSYHCVCYSGYSGDGIHNCCKFFICCWFCLVARLVACLVATL